MRRAELLRFGWWVERVGEQQEGVDVFGIFRRKHGGLASAVGVAAEEESRISARLLAEEVEGLAESCTIGGAFGRARRAGVALAERKVATEDRPVLFNEPGADGYEDRGVRMGAGAVCQDQRAFGG